MKIKIVVGFLVSLAALSGMVIGLHRYAAELDVELDAPKILSMSYKDGKATFTWSAVEFATSYRLYKMNGDGGWTMLKPVGTDTRSFTADGFGTYAVRACNVAGEKTTLSDYATAEFSIKTPEILSAVRENGKTTFTWSAVDFVTSYRVYVKGADGKWSLLEPVGFDRTSYTVDKEGQYSVRACCVSGDTTVLSSYSAAVKVAGE